MTKVNVQLSMGCLSKPLSQQMDEHGIKYEMKAMTGFDKDMETLNGLKFRNLFTRGEIDKAYDRLAKDVFKHVSGVTVGD